MAGTSSTERRVSHIKETAVGTTPTTPNFQPFSFMNFAMTANPRISEQKSIAAGGQRTGLVNTGYAVSGTASTGWLYGEYDDFFESLYQNTWASNVLTNGNQQVTMTVEERIPQGQGGTVSYLRYRGVEVSSATISLVSGEDADLSFNLIGIGSDDASTTIITSATYTHTAQFDPLSCGSDISTLTMVGVGTIDCMQTMEIRFLYDGKDEQLRLGSDELCGITRGSFLPEITGQFYIEDNFLTLYNACRAGSFFALTVTIGTSATRGYTLEFPKCSIVEAPLVSGESGPAFQNFRILPFWVQGASNMYTSRLTRLVPPTP